MIMSPNPNKHTSRMIKAIDLGFDNAQPKMSPDAQFGFRAILKTNGVEISNESLDMEFDIPFDDDMVANEAEFVIYNLSWNTINQFKNGNPITMTAGYGADTGVIFDGFISKVSTKSEGVDRVTTICALDDVKYTPQMMSEKTYAKGTKASTILKDLLSKTGLQIEAFSPTRDYTYQDETKIEGSITENIKKYCEVCGVSAYVYKQRIYCRSLKDGDNLYFNVNSDTGMIDSPEPFEEETSSENYTDTITGYDVNMILQHRISTAGIVKLDSKSYKGEFRIKSGNHSYDGLSATTRFKCIDTIKTTIQKEDIKEDVENIDLDELEKELDEIEDEGA